MSEMIERVAKALHEVDDRRSNEAFRVAWADCLPAYREMVLQEARAAIEAMRVLPPDLLARALHDIDDVRGPMRETVQVFREFHRAMIDSALSEGAPD